jgi:hypothetical protein
MFSNPNPLDRNLDEGWVIQTDVRRGLCRVKTLEGKVLDSVQVLGIYGGSSRQGDRSLPKKGNRVVISYGLGHPVILGTLPRQEVTTEAFPISLNGDESVETGRYMPETYGTMPDPNKPSDIVVGDRVISGDAGNVVAVLKAGSVLVRASRLAEILLSKVSSMVRVVSKSWVHFTDSFTDIGMNISNRLYRYTGYAINFAEGKQDEFRFHQIYGDVSAGEIANFKFDSNVTVPEVGPSVFKEKVTDAAGATPVMFRTIGLNGDEEVWVSNGSTFTRMKATGSAITFSFGDQHIITIDGDKIDFLHHGGAHTTMTNDGITSTFKDGTWYMKDDGVKTTYKNGTVYLAADKITSTYSGGTIVMDSSQVRTTFGGHYLAVTSSGIAMG